MQPARRRLDLSHAVAVERLPRAGLEHGDRISRRPADRGHAEERGRHCDRSRAVEPIRRLQPVGGDGRHVPRRRVGGGSAAAHRSRGLAGRRRAGRGHQHGDRRAPDPLRRGRHERRRRGAAPAQHPPARAHGGRCALRGRRPQERARRGRAAAGPTAGVPGAPQPRRGRPPALPQSHRGGRDVRRVRAGRFGATSSPWHGTS